MIGDWLGLSPALAAIVQVEVTLARVHRELPPPELAAEDLEAALETLHLAELDADERLLLVAGDRYEPWECFTKETVAYKLRVSWEGFAALEPIGGWPS